MTVLDPERSEPVEVFDDVNTSVVAALVAEDDVLLLEAAADADVEGFCLLQCLWMPFLPPLRAQVC